MDKCINAGLKSLLESGLPSWNVFALIGTGRTATWTPRLITALDTTRALLACDDGNMRTCARLVGDGNLPQQFVSMNASDSKSTRGTHTATAKGFEPLDLRTLPIGDMSGNVDRPILFNRAHPLFSIVPSTYEDAKEEGKFSQSEAAIWLLDHFVSLSTILLAAVSTICNGAKDARVKRYVLYLNWVMTCYYGMIRQGRFLRANEREAALVATQYMILANIDDTAPHLLHSREVVAVADSKDNKHVKEDADGYTAGDDDDEVQERTRKRRRISDGSAAASAAELNNDHIAQISGQGSETGQKRLKAKAVKTNRKRARESNDKEEKKSAKEAEKAPVECVLRMSPFDLPRRRAGPHDAEVKRVKDSALPLTDDEFTTRCHLIDTFLADNLKINAKKCKEEKHTEVETAKQQDKIRNAAALKYMTMFVQYTTFIARGNFMYRNQFNYYTMKCIIKAVFTTHTYFGDRITSGKTSMTEYVGWLLDQVLTSTQFDAKHWARAFRDHGCFPVHTANTLAKITAPNAHSQTAASVKPAACGPVSCGLFAPGVRMNRSKESDALSGCPLIGHHGLGLDQLIVFLRRFAPRPSMKTEEAFPWRKYTSADNIQFTGILPPLWSASEKDIATRKMIDDCNKSVAIYDAVKEDAGKYADFATLAHFMFRQPVSDAERCFRTVLSLLTASLPPMDAALENVVCKPNVERQGTSGLTVSTNTRDAAHGANERMRLLMIRNAIAHPNALNAYPNVRMLTHLVQPLVTPAALAAPVAMRLQSGGQVYIGPNPLATDVRFTSVGLPERERIAPGREKEIKADAKAAPMPAVAAAVATAFKSNEMHVFCAEHKEIAMTCIHTCLFPTTMATLHPWYKVPNCPVIAGSYELRTSLPGGSIKAHDLAWNLCFDSGLYPLQRPYNLAKYYIVASCMIKDRELVFAMMQYETGKRLTAMYEYLQKTGEYPKVTTDEPWHTVPNYVMLEVALMHDIEAYADELKSTAYGRHTMTMSKIDKVREYYTAHGRLPVVETNTADAELCSLQLATVRYVYLTERQKVRFHIKDYGAKDALLGILSDCRDKLTKLANKEPYQAEMRNGGAALANVRLSHGIAAWMTRVLMDRIHPVHAKADEAGQLDDDFKGLCDGYNTGVKEEAVEQWLPRAPISTSKVYIDASKLQVVLREFEAGVADRMKQYGKEPITAPFLQAMFASVCNAGLQFPASYVAKTDLYKRESNIRWSKYGAPFCSKTSPWPGQWICHKEARIVEIDEKKELLVKLPAPVPVVAAAPAAVAVVVVAKAAPPVVAAPAAVVAPVPIVVHAAADAAPKQKLSATAAAVVAANHVVDEDDDDTTDDEADDTTVEAREQTSALANMLDEMRNDLYADVNDPTMPYPLATVASAHTTTAASTSATINNNNEEDQLVDDDNVVVNGNSGMEGE
jgi:hypothetical protein